MLEWYWLLSFLVLGGLVGVAAGLFGVGGGGIMVPILTTIFVINDFSPDQVVHLALGTSMAAIVPTSLGSMLAHHARGAVNWSVVRMITPAILLGTLSATFIAALIPTLWLAVFFTLFMAYVALQIWLDIKPKALRNLPTWPGMSVAGLVIGGVSALVAIGGGSLSVPFMLWCNVQIRNAIATSAGIGFPIALAGTAGYIINGWQQPGLPEYTIGFVYWPAVLTIAVVSYFATRIGVKMAHSLPVGTLKKLFAVLLLLLSVKMMVFIIH